MRQIIYVSKQLEEGVLGIAFVSADKYMEI